MPGTAIPRIMCVRLLTLVSYRYQKIEFQIEVQGVTGNPFRSSEVMLDAIVTLPSAKTMRVPCFYFTDYLVQGNLLVLVKNSEQWRLRFASPEIGLHTCTFYLRIRDRLVDQVKGPTFSVGDSELHGMVRQSKQSPRFLQFDDNSPYVPVGQNLCFLTERAKKIPIYPDCGLFPPSAAPDLGWNSAYERWLTKMAENGANWARLWMRPLFSLDDSEPWQFNQENARRLDEVLEKASALGIYLCLCLEDVRDLFHPISGISTANWFSGHESALRRVVEFGGGRQTQDYFTSPLPLEMMRDKLRYFIARWGYSSHVFCWELWNEIQCVEANPILVAEWVKQMTGFLRNCDPFHHLIKSPYAYNLYFDLLDGRASEDFDRATLLSREYGDLNDAHGYFGWDVREEAKDLALYINLFSAPLAELDLPFLVGECGLSREVNTPLGLTADLADRDTQCVHIHEGLWGGLFSGSCGTGMAWWWDEHMDRWNGYWRFRGISNYILGVPFHQEAFEVGEGRVSDPQLRARILQGRSICLVWVQHKKFTFWSAIQHEPIPIVQNAMLACDGFQPGEFLVEFWDTVNGTILGKTTVIAQTANLVIELPEITTDVALKIIPLNTLTQGNQHGTQL